MRTNRQHKGDVDENLALPRKSKGKAKKKPSGGATS